ncbi:hypothetical protein OESDEN_11842 [Oesophagostomum dentatum]|uniref:Uncharacterized protein n=1 Tax=Oesophagostomum dentatum TaxID=61180 RepID=A0A0B1SYT6_OESDE|nr:hypothetical protein OESDEN_11842 [Oesophagostomum dentatum]
MPDYCQGKNFTKIENLKKLSSKPLSVGKVSKSASKKKASRKMKTGLRSLTSPEEFGLENPNITETTLIIDGEIRTLRYELLDWQGQSVESPDFETLTKIMAQQFVPSLLPPNHPMEEPAVFEPRFANDTEDLPPNSTESKDDHDFFSVDEQNFEFRSEERPEIVSGEVLKEGVHDRVAIGLVVFVATVIYWLLEAAREI